MDGQATQSQLAQPLNLGFRVRRRSPSLENPGWVGCRGGGHHPKRIPISTTSCFPEKCNFPEVHLSINGNKGCSR
eukprot:3043641-Amphidinium_carterae.1